MDTIVNKIAASGLITLDLETFMPSIEDIAVFDLKPFLFKELLLKEKDFRAAIADYDFSIFNGKIVGIHCSSDAIIPMWAYMLVTMYMAPYARKVYYGDAHQIAVQNAIENIQQLDVSPYIDGRLIIKGCGDRGANEGVYMAISEKLLPVVKTLMFGEPCSTVPIYKKKKDSNP